jgi:hypothetical protein
MEPISKAPRLCAYLQRSEGRSFIVMPREHWNLLNVNSTNIVNIDINKTPLSKVGQDCLILAAVANKSRVADARISIYRFDEKDQPTPVNLDNYQVWLNLFDRPEIDKIVRAASTSLDSNLRRFSEENVFLVLEEPGEGHWLSDLPDPVKAVIKFKST